MNIYSVVALQEISKVIVLQNTDLYNNMKLYGVQSPFL